MIKKLLVVIFLASQLVAFAQKEKKNEKIEYYTDSDVHRAIVSVQLGYMPYHSNRRLLAESVNPQAPFFYLNSAVTGDFAQAYGGDLLFKINPNFEAGVGLYNSYAKYTWDAVKIIDDISGNGDTLGGTYKVDMKANYLNVPISFGFVSEVAENWWLQVYPALELNFLQNLERTYQIDNPALQPKNNDAFGDITDLGTQFNLTINFGLGAEYRFADKMGVFTRMQFRYMFYEVIEDAALREVIYTFGGHIGLRYYF